MMDQFPKQPSVEFLQQKQKYEQQLWDEAEHLAETREALLERQKVLYGQLNNPTQPIKDFDIRRKMEDEYWNIPKSLEAVAEKEAQLQSLLEQLDKGTIDEEKIKELFPYEDKKAREIRMTKNKAHRLEQIKAIKDGMTDIFFDPWGFGYSSMFWQGAGSRLEPNRLTTGRHATGVKNVGSSLEAQDQFFHQTADTHGGKVGYGKNGESYTSSSGKKIRKR